MRFERWSVVLSVLLAFLLALTLGVAQAQTSAAAADAASTASAFDTGTAAETQVSSEQVTEIRQLPTEYGHLKAMRWIAIALSVAGGLALYVYRFNLYRPHPSAYGLLTALLAVLVLDILLDTLLLPSGAGRCSAYLVVSGPTATAFDDACRLARESAGDLGGMLTLYRKVVLPPDSDVVVPVGATAVNVISCFAGILWTLILFFALKPLAKRLFVR